MQLLTAELRAQLPRLHTQRDREDPIVYALFYALEEMRAAWYVIEGQPDGEDFCFYGYVVRPSREDWREFLLSELEAIKGPSDLGVVAARNYLPTRFSIVRTSLLKHLRQHGPI